MKTTHWITLLLSLVVVCPIGAQQKDEILRTVNGDNGTPNLIILKQESARQNLSMQDSKEILQRNLSTNAQDDFKLIKTESDQLGFEHQKFQQIYNGIEVEFATYKVHGKNGFAEKMSGHYVPISSLSVSPSLAKDNALKSAIALSKVDEDVVASQGKLVICENFVSGTMEPRLAYKFELEGMKNQEYYKADVYIDATNGNLLLENLRVYHHHEREEVLRSISESESSRRTPGNADTRYSGSLTIEAQSVSGGYRLFDNTRGGGVHTKNANNSSSWNFSSATEFIDNDNNWTAAEWDNADLDNAALDAHWASEMTYDYFFQRHGRNSYDGNGAQMRNLVHALSNWFNAQWNGSTMRYGDGNANNPLTTLDVGAHEMSHGVTQFSANLIYQGESGALNEAFSDIFAATVENFADKGKQLWLVGEEIGYIRNMENPNDKSDPDTYQGSFWAPTSGADNGGVHTNSGVLNHWFYILSVGKSGTNDNGDSYSVTALTIEEAEKIAYRMLTVYLSASSNYNAARTAGIQSAIDIYGAGSNEEIQTTNAFYAVGVGAAYDDGTPPDPVACSTTISSFPYSESFESGTGSFSQQSGDDLDWTRDSGGTPSNGTGPSSGSDGSFYMYIEASGNGTGYPTKNAILNAPCFNTSSLTSAELSFSYHMNGTALGTLIVETSTDGGTSWNNAWSISGSQGNSWNSATVALPSSSEVRVRFNGTTGSSWSSDIAIDGVSVGESGGDPDPDPVCNALSFTGATLITHSGSDAGNYTIIDDSTLLVEDNTWRALSMNYTVTSSTVINFEFRSTSQGEIHGIAFENNSGASSDLTFKVHGTQNWGITNYDNYSGSDWVSYSIPVGTFYTGNYDRLVFCNDNDAGSGNNSYFRNVVIHEGGCGTSVTSFGDPVVSHFDDGGESLGFSVYPIPATNELKVSLNEAVDINYSIYSVTGQLILSGNLKELNNKIDIRPLGTGTYLLQLKGDEMKETIRFTKN